MYMRTQCNLHNRNATLRKVRHGVYAVTTSLLYNRVIHSLFSCQGYCRWVKVISGALIDYDNSHVDAALVKDEAGGGDPCYIIEKHKDGRATVLLPWSPASFAGSIKIVQQSQLEVLPCTLDEFSRSLSQIGVGVEECMSKPPPTDQQS